MHDYNFGVQTKFFTKTDFEKLLNQVNLFFGEKMKQKQNETLLVVGNVL